MQVEHIRLTLGWKALGCQPVESTSPFKVLWFQMIVNLHRYIPAALHQEGLGLTTDSRVCGGEITRADLCSGKGGAEEAQASP